MQNELCKLCACSVTFDSRKCLTFGDFGGRLNPMPQDDVVRIAQAVQAVTAAQIAELGDVSLETLVQLVSVVLQNSGGIAAPTVADGWRVHGADAASQANADMALTTNQAAARLGMSRPFLIKLCDQGDIPFHRVGRDRRILISDINDYLARRDAEKLRFKQSTLSLT